MDKTTEELAAEADAAGIETDLLPAVGEELDEDEIQPYEAATEVDL
jgi:hypothetical protein